MRERRQHTRIDSLNLLAYTCFDNDGNTVEQGMGRTLNVSESGILLETNIELEANNKVAVTVAIEETLVEIQGSVIRSQLNAEGMYESGIKFSDISADELKVLRSYVAAFEEGLA